MYMQKHMEKGRRAGWRILFCLQKCGKAGEWGRKKEKSRTAEPDESCDTVVMFGFSPAGPVFRPPGGFGKDMKERRKKQKKV